MDNYRNSSGKTGLPQDTRGKMVNRIVDTSDQNVPRQSIGELSNIAQCFEESVFPAATDRHEYSEKLSLKMLCLQPAAQATPANPVQGAEGIVKSQDPGPTPLMQTGAQTLSTAVQFSGQVTSQDQKRLRHLGQFHQDSLTANVMQSSSSLGLSLPGFTGIPPQQRLLQSNDDGLAKSTSSGERAREGKGKRKMPGSSDMTAYVVRLSADKLTSNARTRCELGVNRIVDTSDGNVTPTGQRSMGELSNIAQRYEESVFPAAADRHDYSEKVSSKMLCLQPAAQATPATPVQGRFLGAEGIVESQDPGPTPLMQTGAQTLSTAVQLSGQARKGKAKAKRKFPDPTAYVVGLSFETLTSNSRTRCEICCEYFPNKESLRSHNRAHNVRNRVYICPVRDCECSTPSRALGTLKAMEQHFLRTHTLEKDKQWRCDKCGKRYAVHSDFKEHRDKSASCGIRQEAGTSGRVMGGGGLDGPSCPKGPVPRLAKVAKMEAEVQTFGCDREWYEETISALTMKAGEATDEILDACEISGRVMDDLCNKENFKGIIEAALVARQNQFYAQQTDEPRPAYPLLGHKTGLIDESQIGRHPVSMAWNLKESRRATLHEVIAYLGTVINALIADQITREKVCAI